MYMAMVIKAGVLVEGQTYSSMDRIKNPEMTHTDKLNLLFVCFLWFFFFSKRLKQFTGEKGVFSTKGAGTTAHSQARKQTSV